jgi:hypothetical protein
LSSRRWNVVRRNEAELSQSWSTYQNSESLKLSRMP